ncbi:hypothetical protein OSJ77_09105 [Phyllobacterium sp. 0TCS1.6C]|uniref:hypothetical protein n=1 Tax=unclassified Phyllobacterium TaxID=2638441 RepID=UPI0022654E4B|nr:MULTISPECIES: hypothetical protein [unclassified Phyllobacterium]MCX8280348.1 hypothetical protein [Phyllobacterium sp. 0TCS1.6C]MCX8295203.1 hypothetical protein [Phyllobacterium sp. 0TCS1.6A]
MSQSKIHSGQTMMNNVFVCAAIVAASLSLVGCVSNNKPWVKDDSPRSETDQALAQCKYEARAATIGIGQGQHEHYKSFGSAIAAGISDGIEQATDEKELIGDCMRAKGFNQ